MRQFAPLAQKLGLDPWTRHRDLPEPPARSFHELMQQQRRP
jgi:hypothetical protein